MSKKGTVFGEMRIHLLENPGFFRLGERERVQIPIEWHLKKKYQSWVAILWYLVNLSIFQGVGNHKL